RAVCTGRYALNVDLRASSLLVLYTSTDVPAGTGSCVMLTFNRIPWTPATCGPNATKSTPATPPASIDSSGCRPEKPSSGRVNFSHAGEAASTVVVAITTAKGATTIPLRNVTAAPPLQ